MYAGEALCVAHQSHCNYLDTDPNKDTLEEEDVRLLEVYYSKFKSSVNSDKYKLIPKFYSRVSLC